MSDWKTAGKELPPTYTKVLAAYPPGDVHMMYVTRDNQWQFAETAHDAAPPIQWCELPTPPTPEESKHAPLRQALSDILCIDVDDDEVEDIIEAVGKHQGVAEVTDEDYVDLTTVAWFLEYISMEDMAASVRRVVEKLK